MTSFHEKWDLPGVEVHSASRRNLNIWKFGLPSWFDWTIAPSNQTICYSVLFCPVPSLVFLIIVILVDSSSV